MRPVPAALVGGTEKPQVWRAAFIVLSVIGCASTLRLPARARGDHFITWRQAASALLYALIAVVGAFPDLARHVGPRPIRTGALMPIALVILAHALVWRYMAGEGRADEDARSPRVQRLAVSGLLPLRR